MTQKKNKMIVLSLVILMVGFASSIVLGYGESPMLQKIVEKGELPPVEERLPENPLVVEPVEQVGEYGGTLYMVAQSLGGFGTDLHVMGFEPPLGLEPNSSVSPNVVKEWTVSEDKKVWTLHLREGIKWSDGVLFTADDIIYWWEDEVNNEIITDSIYIQEFKDMELSKIDEYTIKIELTKPYPMFKYTLSKQWGYLGKWWRPAHYLKQFHPKYAGQEKVEKMAEEGDFDSIRDFYLDKAGWSAKPKNPECPTLIAYKLVEKKPDYWVWERNPYFWKVDSEGNQLPYIDKLIVRKVADVETIQGQIISGEVDIAVWNTTLENYPLYKENENSGEFRTMLWQSDRGSEVVYMPNQNTEDPVLRKIFQNPKFRRALSLGIDREEINELLYFGEAVPRQFTLHPSSKYYKEEWAEAYAEYDPERANKLLDEIGLKEKDADGYRLRSDGKTLEFVVEYWPAEPATKTPMTELVKDYWADLGIKMALKPQSRSLNSQRAEANKIAMNMWHGGGVTDSQWPNTLTPPITDDTGISWGGQWKSWWNTDGEEGMEPPADIKELFGMGDRFTTSLDEDQRMQMGQQIWQRQADELWYIGTVGMAPYPIVLKSNLRNVPEKGTFSSDLLWLHTYHPEQFYLEQ